jgi:beta-lactamase class A
MIICAQVLIFALQVCIPSLSQKLPEIAAPAGGRVGVAAGVLETRTVVSMNADDHFPMQSVYKVPIVMAVLKNVDEGKLQLNEQVRIEASDLPPVQVHSPLRDKYPNGGVSVSLRELMRAAIVESDGGASDRLLKLVPPNDVNKYLSSIAIKDLVVLNTEKELAGNSQVQYENWTTPAAAASLLMALQEGKSGLTPRSRNLVLLWMRTTKTGVRRIRARLPKGTVVADKTGTSGTVDGLTAATNDIAIVTLPNGRHLVIAVFVSNSKADQTVREGVIAKIARVTWDCLGK